MKRIRVDIINLHYRIVLPNQELKSYIRRVAARKKLNQVIVKHACRSITSINGIHGLPVHLHPHKPFSPGALVEVSAKAEVVWYSIDGRNVLVQACGILVGGRADGTGLIEFICVGGGVAGGGDGVSGISDVSSDPRCKAAFEATIYDGVAVRVSASEDAGGGGGGGGSGSR